MSVRVSAHAVERYVDRIDSNASWDTVHELLLDALGTATRQRERTHAGDAVYIADDFRLVVAEENGHREVLTVLPLHAGQGDRALPEVAEQLAAEFNRWQEEQGRPAVATGQGKVANALRCKIDELLRGIERRQKFISQALGQGVPPRAVAKHDKRRDQELKVALDRLASAEKKLARQVAHAQRMTADREEARNALKAVLAFVATGDAAGALAEAEARVPQLLEHLAMRHSEKTT